VFDIYLDSLRPSIIVPFQVPVSIAYGGMQYAIVDANAVGLSLEPSRGREICRLGEMIKRATRDQHPVTHPELDYPGPDILVFRDVKALDTGMPNTSCEDAAAATCPVAYGGKHHPPRLHARNAVVMSNGAFDWERPETWTGMIDRCRWRGAPLVSQVRRLRPRACARHRSPCGTGTCAVMALMHARGQLALGQEFEHESILGTKFVGRLLSTTMVGAGTDDEVLGVIPTIRGQAWITAVCACNV